MRLLLLVIALRAHLAHCAVNINGERVIELLNDNDPAPVSDPSTYIPEQYNCPVPCTDYTNIHSWTPFITTERLKRCKEPMLLQFSVSHPLDDPKTTVLIRSCATGGGNPMIQKNVQTAQVDNPKKDEKLIERSIDTAQACFKSGTEDSRDLRIVATDSDQANSTEVGKLLDGLKRFYDEKDNCDESVVFAYYRGTVVSMFIGDGYGKATAASLIATAQSSALRSNSTIAQVCGKVSTPERTLGLLIDRSGDLLSAQRAAATWSNGECVQISGANGTNTSMGYTETMQPVKTWEISTANGTSATNGTLSITGRLSRMARSQTSNTMLRPRADPPKPQADGTCATHLIGQGDDCSKLAKKYSITIEQIESFNKGKTWAWTSCEDGILLGYNMCVSKGTPPLPPAQEGTECGPIVPGTKQPSGSSTSLADLNPCPLKACCSNWGFCGPFSEHCEVHAPKGGGPGSKLAEYRTTCISNCGNKIKENSGPPTKFERIGYYESWNMNRDCLWLKAKNANTDGTYTHIHWGFIEIDDSTFKPVIVDKHKQWDGFKKLKNIKKIISFGGWAYSTEKATFNIIRRAIINNRELFATNIAKFLEDEGLDGVDIDWEYPGAPDILVDGHPIGQKGDGASYLRFLTVLKDKVGDKSVSIAAPASYWYLKAFPIDQIAKAIDYIVFMTYDLHGIWDADNPNAFDSCPSGRCIRSHVNITETRNSLSIITKAGVPNNKIFVGESSYGRSFHMAEDGCWGPMCEFTDSRTKADSAPGRCTGQGGYIALAEINEILGKEPQTRSFQDTESDTDIVLYNGDYISYQTYQNKENRRKEWKELNFAGSIDWAVDLQEFGKDDFEKDPGNRSPGEEGCVGGSDYGIDSSNLCSFSCAFDFCPESICECRVTGRIKQLPKEVSGMDDIIAWDEWDVDLNRLCKFACKHGYCPEDMCTHSGKSEEDDDSDEQDWFDYDGARKQNAKNCQIFKDPAQRGASIAQCEGYCKKATDAAKAEGRTTNYGCVGFYPTSEYPKGIPWTKWPGGDWYYAPAKCNCDNWLVNYFMDFVMEMMPIVAQIGCFILMSSLKLVLDIGLELFKVGKVLDAGMGKFCAVSLSNDRKLTKATDMAASAAQIAKYAYDEDQDPEGAFSWWLSPCGSVDLVPDEIKKAFDILNSIPDGLTSWKKPKDNKGKGTGKKGDDWNPTDRSKPKAGTKAGPNGTGSTNKQSNCKIRPGEEVKRMGPEGAKNTLRKQECVAGKTQKRDWVITSVEYGAKPTAVIEHCDKAWSQACYHYSSVIRENPAWKTMVCPQENAVPAPKKKRRAPDVYYRQHNGADWLNWQYRREEHCDADEYPPLYLIGSNDQTYIQAGRDVTGQQIRYIPWKDNEDAGDVWKGACFGSLLTPLSNKEFEYHFRRGSNVSPGKNRFGTAQTSAKVKLDYHPEFSFGSWGQSGQQVFGDGLFENHCWPNILAPQDPGFALLTFDKFYGYPQPTPPPYDYKRPVPNLPPPP